MKVRADHEAVRERLAELDAEPVGTVVQTDTYYDAPHRSFADTDEALRIRRERRVDAEETAPDDAVPDGAAERAVLTYKGPRVDDASKTRVEHETGVGDAAAADAVLRGLGFAPAATVEKERERYRLDGFAVVLDEVEGLGEFVEVEGAASETDVAAVSEAARAVVERLGLDPDEQVRTSYLGLLLEE